MQRSPHPRMAADSPSTPSPGAILQTPPTSLRAPRAPAHTHFGPPPAGKPFLPLPAVRQYPPARPPYSLRRLRSYAHQIHSHPRQMSDVPSFCHTPHMLPSRARHCGADREQHSMAVFRPVETAFTGSPVSEALPYRWKLARNSIPSSRLSSATSAADLTMAKSRANRLSWADLSSTITTALARARA